MQRNLIFVTGIHGVGKTSRCKKISDELGFVCLNAGEVIGREKENISSNQDKRVFNVNDNQMLLIKGIKKHVSEKNLLLDGHLTLIGLQYEIEKVPIQFLREINPTLLILLINSPEEIVKNLKGRDSQDYGIELITSQQRIESEYAEQIAKELDIQMIRFNSYDEAGIIKFLKGRLQPPLQ